LRLVFFILFTINFAIANNAVYEQVLVGEKNIDHYYGPSFPKVEQSLDDGFLSWNELGSDGPFMDSIFFEKSAELEGFFSHELSAGLVCPNYFLNKHISYIRYAYRLLTISYLYEAINNYQVTLDLLNKNNSCKPNWGKTFKTCRAKSVDMKKYLSNLARVGKLFSSKVDAKKKYRNFKKDWYSDFYSNKSSTLSHLRINANCYINGINCVKLSKSKIIKKLNHSCKSDLQLLQKVCSEQDQLYGMSYLPEVIDLISDSNIINVFNKDGMARGCLSRYSQMMSAKEVNYKFLVDIFPAISEQLYLNYGQSYIQGKLFIPGSFKEFEDKGLVNVYEKEIKQSVKKITAKKIVKEIVKEVIVVADAKVTIKKKKNIIKIKNIKKNPKVVIVKKTAFLIAVERLHQNNLSQVKVDMPKFKYDFIFTFGLLKKLKKSLKSYMSQSALKEMKKFDDLGGKQAPIPLIFIKYMIDTKQHHGLYNIMSIVGDRFWVLNTIDKKNKYLSNLVELRNDISTSMKWQITVLDKASINK
jgi:hypothetical protein